MNFRTAIRDEMQRQAVTQSALAKAAETSQPRLSSYLGGKRDLRGQTVERLLSALGLELRPASGDEESDAMQAMKTTEGRGPYRAVRDVVESLGGCMTWKPGGGPGGAWLIELDGRSMTVDCRDQRPNQLDAFYRLKDEDTPPTHWDDYTKELLPEPEARLHRLLAR